MRPGGPIRKPTISLTGLLFGVFLVASLVFLYRLFHNPDQTYTPVEVRDAGPFQPREEEEADRKAAPDAKPVSSLEFIPRRQVPLSPPGDEAAKPELPDAQTAAPEPPPAVTATPPASPPPTRPARQIVRPQFTPMPETKPTSGASSAAFLAAPKAAAEPKSAAGSSGAAGAPAQSKQSSAAKTRGRHMQAIIP